MEGWVGGCKGMEEDGRVERRGGGEGGRVGRAAGRMEKSREGIFDDSNFRCEYVQRYLVRMNNPCYT